MFHSMSLFDHLFGSLLEFDNTRTWTEGNKAFVRIILPGFDKGNISVVANDGILTVDASNKSQKHAFENSEYHQRFSLPKNAKEEKVSAEYTNGILLIEVPLEDEIKNKKKMIEIK